MTPRTSLFVAFIGLVIATSCAIPLYFIGNRAPVNDNADMGIVLLGLSGILGFTVLVVGLIMAAVTVLRGKRRHRSRLQYGSYLLIFEQSSKNGAAREERVMDNDN
jgi:hypothetical protein